MASVLVRGKRRRALNMRDSATVTVGLWISICAHISRSDANTGRSDANDSHGVQCNFTGASSDLMTLCSLFNLLEPELCHGANSQQCAAARIQTQSYQVRVGCTPARRSP